MKLGSDEWTIGHLHDHLQYAVALEFWTIPFYMSAMFSIIDRSSSAYQLIQSVVNQEMLHLQLASNIANAYGLSPVFDAPTYEDQAIPHLDFALDLHDPRPEFSPFSAEIRPLRAETVNAMCLIEYPEWGQGEPDLHDNVTEYGSIGAFYDALQYGARLLQSQVRGGIRQVDYFSAFYNDLPAMTVSNSGAKGFREVTLLLSVIRAQGEGANSSQVLSPPFRNTADDGAPSQDHYTKFLSIREAKLPATYPTEPLSGHSAQTAPEMSPRGGSIEHFGAFRAALADLFAGRQQRAFLPLMVQVGAEIQNCWKKGIVPAFG